MLIILFAAALSAAVGVFIFIQNLIDRLKSTEKILELQNDDLSKFLAELEKTQINNEYLKEKNQQLGEKISILYSHHENNMENWGNYYKDIKIFNENKTLKEEVDAQAQRMNVLDKLINDQIICIGNKFSDIEDEQDFFDDTFKEINYELEQMKKTLEIIKKEYPVNNSNRKVIPSKSPVVKLKKLD